MPYPVVTNKMYATQNENGKSLTVRPNPNPDSQDFCVVLMNTDKSSEEYFGTIRFSGSLDFMKKLGQSLIDCVNDIEEKTIKK